MAHKLLGWDIKPKERKQFKLPSFSGKFGISLYIGSKEIFIGLSINDVDVEKVVKKRFVRVPKSKVQVYNFEA